MHKHTGEYKSIMYIVLHTELNADECRRRMKEAIKKEGFITVSMGSVSKNRKSEQLNVTGRIYKKKFYIYNRSRRQGLPLYFRGKFISNDPSSGTRIEGKLSLPWYFIANLVLVSIMISIFLVALSVNLLNGSDVTKTLPLALLLISLYAAFVWQLLCAKRKNKKDHCLIEFIKSTLNATNMN